ncbi:MaoC/PaaZ C-terminal domain-containing protein [Streptomyces spiralis]|nr:MaoC/PaaZ C-terminal domain-containing protein [Streptomyces spiralis]
MPEIKQLAGRDLGHSAWEEVTQQLIDTFADVSGDHQWIHTDTGRAAYGPYGRTIAHGYMILSFGSRIRLHASITEVHEVKRGGVQMHRAFIFELEGAAKPACVAQSLTHFHP